MAYTPLPGMGATWPSTLANFAWSNSNVAYTSLANNAAAKVAQCGFAWWPDASATTKEVAHVLWLCAGRTVPAGTQWRVSIQGVSTTSGPPMQPDGVIAGSFVSTAGQTPTLNVYSRNTLSAPVALTRGQLISVVHDWVNWVSTATLLLQFVSPYSGQYNNFGGTSYFGGTGSWQAQTSIPNVLLEFTDGTFGTLFGTLPMFSPLTRNWGSGATGSGSMTTGNERGLEFTPTATFFADGVIYEAYNFGVDTTYNVTVYEGTTPLSTYTGDNDIYMFGSGDTRRTWVPFSEVIEFKKNTLYRVMIKVTSTDTFYMRTYSIPYAGVRALYHGTTALGNSRTGSGAFGAGSATELPIMMLTIATVAGGSGLLTTMRRNQVD